MAKKETHKIRLNDVEKLHLKERMKELVNEMQEINDILAYNKVKTQLSYENKYYGVGFEVQQYKLNMWDQVL